MGATDFVGRSEWLEFMREWRQFKNASPLGNSSVDRGALQILSAEGLIVKGSQRVSGVLIVSGEETVDGVLRVSGTLIVSGETEISGTTEITGPTTITGTFGIDGDTTLSGTLTVRGGEIIIDGTTPIRLGANSSGVATMSLGSSEIRGADGGIVLDPGSGAAIATGSAGVRIFLLPDAPADAQPNCHINSLGYLSVIR